MARRQCQESSLESGESQRDRLSMVISRQRQGLHYELRCNPSSALVRNSVGGDQRKSLTWDEFFGSSLELAPSLLNIYDNLAACSNSDDKDDDPTFAVPNSRAPHHVPVHTDHSCVASSCAGFWVTDRDSNQCLFVRSSLRSTSSGLPCDQQPTSLMESDLEVEEDMMDKDKFKKRSLSSGSLSSSSMSRPQHKRPNLHQDGEEDFSDYTSQTSSDSNLTATSDRGSITSDRASLTSDRSSTTSVEDSTTTTLWSPVKRPGSEEERTPEVQTSGHPERPVLKMDIYSCGDTHQPTSPSFRSPSLSSRSSTTSSILSTSPLGYHQHPLQQQNSLAMAVASAEAAAASHRSSPSCCQSSGSGSLNETPRKPQPVEMKPLQTTMRPVVISLPESIRKVRNRSMSGGGTGVWGVCGAQTNEESGQISSHDSLNSSTLTPPGSATSITSASVDSPATASSVGSPCLVASPLQPAKRLRSPSAGESVCAGSEASIRVRAGKSSVSVSGVISPIYVPPTSSGSFSSSTTGSTTTRPISPPSFVAQHSFASPLSPTALARRKFLASHFDLPDIPLVVEEKVPKAEGEEKDASLEQCSASDTSYLDEEGWKDNVIVQEQDVGIRQCQVSLSVSDANNNHSASSTTCSEKKAGSSCHVFRSKSDASSTSRRDEPPRRQSDTLPRSQKDRSPPSAACWSPESSSRSPSGPDLQKMEVTSVSSYSDTSWASLPKEQTSSPKSSRRSLKKSDGGSVSGRGGSVKGGSYMTYVQRVVMEIVDTERMYVSSLEAIIKGYKEPLEKLLGDSESGREDLACLFCNITQIYAFGRTFLSDLEQCGQDPVKVAECFVEHNKGFVIYTDYCTNYPRAVEVLTKFMQDAELSEVCKTRQMSLGHGLPLGAYLLRPVQRILKYHLLLQNILKNFDKNRPGYATLEKAFCHMTDMAHHINEMKRRHEHAVRIQEVQSQLEDYIGEDLTRLGDLVLEGSFRVYGAKASRQVFLFEKGILISKKKEGGMLTCKACIPCSNLMLVEVIPNEPLSFHIIPFDNPRAQHTLQARSLEQKRHWCQEIKRLILESYKGRIPDNVKSLVMELGRNHDNDYVGKDTIDSSWKHQHTAPEYLEKRRVRRKSGGKVPDLLKLPKVGAKRDQGAAGSKSKSPKAWRRTDFKFPGTWKEQITENIPMMLISAGSSTFIGIGATSSVGSEAPNLQKPDPVTASQQANAVQNDNDQNNDTSKSSEAMDISEENSKPEAVQRRATSFKRAVRLQSLLPLPQDLIDLPFDGPMPEATNPSEKAEDSPSVLSDDRGSESFPGNQQPTWAESEVPNDTAAVDSPSDSESSSDAENGGRQPPPPSKLDKENCRLSSIYSSMPALSGLDSKLERRPAQKRRPGETRSGLSRAKKDLSKSSDGLATVDAGASQAGRRQYRRRWEGQDDGLQKRVPALHDSYERRSRESFLRQKGSNPKSSGAKLTDWGSVDKLMHGSMSDLSYLKEDPWVKKTDCSVQPSISFCRDSHQNSNAAPDAHADRSLAFSCSQKRNGVPISGTMSLGRPRNYSDITGVTGRAGKEHVDWLVYASRVSGEENRERANSLRNISEKSSATSSVLHTRALPDSSSNISRSFSLCQDTLKRYSSDLSDPNEVPGESCVPSASTKVIQKPTEGPSVRASSEDKENTLNFSVMPLSSINDNVEMLNNSKGSISPERDQAGHKADPSIQTAAVQPLVQPVNMPESSSDISNHRSSASTQDFVLPPFLSAPGDEGSDQTIESHSTSSHNIAEDNASSHNIAEDNASAHGVAEPNVSSPDTQLFIADAPPSLPQHSFRPLSPETAALSAEGERMLAEMEQYYEANSPKTPPMTSKFPSSVESPQGQTKHFAEASSVDINRLSGVSSVSSSSTDGCTGHYSLSSPPDNTNRMSIVSSVSTSSFESQNSNSSDSLVGSLKNKLTMWTHKLGSKRSRDEERTPSGSRDGLSSLDNLKRSELQSVLREHCLGSPLMGSRMAKTLPVGLEPILSPATSPDQTYYSLLDKEDIPESQSRFSFPSAVHHRKSAPDILPVSQSVQQSDSGISMYSEESNEPKASESKIQGQKANTLPPNLDSNLGLAIKADTERRKRLDSASSVESGDSFYERRLSLAFESNIFHGQGQLESQQREFQSAEEPHLGPRKSIREVVQYIEEKFRPHQPKPIEVKRKEPSAFIRQRLQSLRDSSSYKGRLSNRSVSEDRLGSRDRTPESPRFPRKEYRSYGGNQFMHRVHPEIPPCGRESRAEKAMRERESLARRQREMAMARQCEAHEQKDGEAAASGREQEVAGREGEPRLGDDEERSEAGTSSGMVDMGSMDHLDQHSADVDNLIIMRGWVRNLINKFQQIT